jgi:GR25 family glycosyltransferase involved in LPS biosynthesis
MIKIFEKIYYINLDEDQNKKKFFIDQINKTLIGDNCFRFSAINGKNLDIDTIDNSIITDYAKKCITEKKQKVFGITLTYGSLACALSHKAIWEECSVSKKPFLIFEDDIIPIKNFNSIFTKILNVLYTIDYDLLYLGYNEIPGFNKTIINDVISKPSGLITGNYAYILSPVGAKKLLSTIFPLNKQFDSSISDNISSFNLFCSTTKLISASYYFGSKTQRSNSCINYIQKQDNEWMKLFNNFGVN